MHLLYFFTFIAFLFMINLKKWKILKSKMVLDYPWCHVRQDEIELPNGKIIDDYFVSIKPDVALSFRGALFGVEKKLFNFLTVFITVYLSELYFFGEVLRKISCFLRTIL